jgi:cellulose synthase/poly-beta-1,6-N-acetylglucosamine synthase-like glycosyltransferase
VKPVSLIVILPAYNEEVVIAKTIQSILVAGIEPHQLYVINDASKDRTSEIAKSLNVNVIDNEVNLGKARGVENALNLIFQDYHNNSVTHVCFMDADTLVDPNYFRTIAKRLEDDLVVCQGDINKQPISILCGQVKSIPHNWLTAFRAYELWLSQWLHKVAQARLNVITVAPGCASTYSVEALEGVTWSDDTTTEDMDSTIQVVVAGGVIQYEGNATVYTQDPNTMQDYIGQVSKRWYPGTWQVMGKHKLLTSGWFKLFNWECRMMTLEPVAFVLAILYTAVCYTSTLPLFLAMSYLFVFPAAVASSIQEKRFDILKYSPIFPFILLVNMFVYVSKIGNIFGRDKAALKWYSPERYTMEEAK